VVLLGHHRLSSRAIDARSYFRLGAAVRRVLPPRGLWRIACARAKHVCSVWRHEYNQIRAALERTHGDRGDKGPLRSALVSERRSVIWKRVSRVVYWCVRLCAARIAQRKIPKAQFCIQCATPFLGLCERSGFENPSKARYRAKCACPFGAGAPVQGEVEAIDGPTGERPHLSVMFCDLVGSTAIAAQLDPEEWRETVAGYQRKAAEAISRFGGLVGKYPGDGAIAFFGLARGARQRRGAHGPRDSRRHREARRTEIMSPVWTST
jgi:hypothetical protein